ncbi:hypothetical protein AWB68_03309 [Caballeronia choica]|uniref:Uncharacterized protein n=1 Tax=Caballeronia choica TaxID=326476 RepID=A0A158J2P7_9BURK|nr:hypothetical protein AWB68_03309 [Caballeronia choica]
MVAVRVEKAPGRKHGHTAGIENLLIRVISLYANDRILGFISNEHYVATTKFRRTAGQSRTELS